MPFILPFSSKRQGLRTQAVCLVLLLLSIGAGKLRAQDQAFNVVPNGSVDIPNTTGGNWYFQTDPTPASATMSRVGPSGIDEYLWAGATPTSGFFSDPNQSLSRIFPGEFLRVYAGNTPAGTTVVVPYDTAPLINNGPPRYTVRVTVVNPSARVQSITLLDPSPTIAASVRWQVTFDRAISGVTAANFAFNNNANNLSPVPTISGVAPTSSGDNTRWTVTANTAGTGTGILGLNWVGHASESPTVPLSFTGFSYQFTPYVIVTSQPPVNAYAQTEGASPSITVQATDRSGGALAYQWMRGSFKAPNSAVAIAGATSNTFNPPTGVAGSISYYCHVSTVASKGGYYGDSTDCLVSTEDPVLATSPPEDAVTSAGASATFSVGAMGSNLRYQWYRGASGDTSRPVSGGTSATVTTPALTVNTLFWVYVYNDLSPSLNYVSPACTAHVVTRVAVGQGGYTLPIGGTAAPAFTASAYDSSGAPVTRAIPVKFSAPVDSSSSATGTFAGNVSGTTVISANGVATSTTFKANLRLGSYTVSASYGQVGGAIAVTNVNGPVANLRITTQPSTTATAGRAFAQQPVVALYDSSGNLRSSDSTTVVTAGPADDGSAYGGTLSVTAVNGVATFTNLVPLRAGDATLRFTAAGVTVDSVLLGVNPSGAAALGKASGDGQVTPPGKPYAAPFVARVTDSYGNPISNRLVTFNVNQSGNGITLSSSGAYTDDNGYASVRVTSSSVNAGTFTLTASSAQLNSTTFTLYSFTQFQLWRYANFNGAYNAYGGPSADGAIPFKDGVTNLIKYAFNLNAQAADVTSLGSGGTYGLPLVGADLYGRLTLTYVRRKAATLPGITYTVQFADTLTAGFAVNPAAATGTPVGIDDTFERVTVTDSVVPSAGKGTRFARMLINDTENP